jgi:outer membrane immunogenic protein
MKLSFTVKAIAAALLLTSTTGLAFANANYKGERNLKGEVPCPPPQVLRDGLYVGIQGGYDSYRVRENIDGIGGPIVNATGGVGGGLIGYGWDFSDMFSLGWGAPYLGVEAFGNYSGVDSSYSITPGAGLSFAHNFKARGGWGVSALPGLKLSPTLLAYARLGYDWSDLRVNESITAPGVFASATTKHTSGGFNWGFGMEGLVIDNWSVRAEYTHTNYTNFTSLTTNYKPADNQVMAAVIYHFVW